MDRTYSFGVEKLLYEWYAVCGRLATPCGGVSEDIAVFEGERDRLLLDSGWTRETEVCEGTKDKGGKEIRKRCECLQLDLLRLRFGHLVQYWYWCKFQTKNHTAKQEHVTPQTRCLFGLGTRKCVTARNARLGCLLG